MQKYLGDLIHFSFRSTTKRTFSCTLHTPTSLCTARSRKAFYLSSSTFGQTWPLWGKEVQGKTEPKICPKREWWFHRSTFFLFLAILYWRVAEFWRLEQKTMKSVIAETYSSLTPKKAKKARKCDKILLYYWVHSYEFELERQPMWKIGSGMNQKTITIVVLSLDSYSPQFKFCQILCKCICATNKRCWKSKMISFHSDHCPKEKVPSEMKEASSGHFLCS